MMKKILTLMISLLLSSSVFGQFTGSGTWDDPYSGGTLTENQTWSHATDTVYVSGDLTVGSGGNLTINAGIFVLFTAVNLDLIITETGRLTADGADSDSITFTADHDDDKIFGESAVDNDAGDWDERWGHISFQDMGAAGVSIIDHCIIEFGDVSGSSLPNRYGGAIHTDFSDLTISNCILRNNKAGWGGGIFVNKGEDPEISNCIILDNTSTLVGGGLYFWENTSSIVTNCIIEGNDAENNTGGGGVFLGDTVGEVKIINCVIVSNTAPLTGKNICFYYNNSSPKPQFINCVIWDATTPISYIGQSAASTDFINCAISNYGISSYTNCISINNNDAADGPNFNATDGTDWSIKVISPCRDSGTDAGAPATDFDGNSRVGAYDIGAYEVQYNYWLTTAGSTDWATGSNWNGGVPTSSQNVVIPSGADNYPTGSSPPDYTIGTGYGMVLEPGAQVTFGALSSNGDLKIRYASDTTSLIMNSEGVNAIVEFYLIGGEAGTSNYRWHYISSPFSSLSTAAFTAVTLNLAQFIQSYYSSEAQAWVAYDGYNYATGLGDPETFNSLSSGTGYNFYDNTHNVITISGQLQYTDVAVGLGFGDNGADYSGFNLLGNPFPSGLDWDVIIDDASYPSETSKGLYFTRNNVQCSYIGGVGTPSDVSGIIPPMQGFFTKTYNTGKTITLLASARTHNSIHARYKGETIIPLVRLSITKDSISDETVVRFDEQADPGLDYNFDALKMFLSDNKISIYSFTGETKYAINGQPFPETEVEIPIVVNLVSEGTHKVSAIQLQGLDNYHVTLKDLVTEFDIDLKTTPELTFTDSAGTYTDRFILTISSTTGIEDIPDLPGLFNVFAANNLINIKTLSDAWNGKSGTVKIFDITGRTVSEIHNKEFWKNSILQVPAPSPKGIYFVELSSGVMRYVGKVSVVK